MGRVACMYSYTWLVRTCIHSVKCTCLYYVSKKSNLNLQNITNSSFSLIKIKEMTQCKTQTCHVHWPGMLTTACFAPTPNAKQAPADNRQWPQYARIMSWWAVSSVSTLRLSHGPPFNRKNQLSGGRPEKIDWRRRTYFTRVMFRNPAKKIIYSPRFKL